MTVALDAGKHASRAAALAWGGADAMKGVKLLALGLAVQVAAFVLILLLPGRP